VVNALLVKEVPWQAQVMPLNIVYEDDDIAIINKPVGLVTHPASGNPDSTLVNALLHHMPNNEHLPRAGIIHRLDKDTSGLLVVAKTLVAHHSLTKAMQAREIHREYECIVYGKLISGATIDEPIGRHPKNRLKQAIIDSGKSAVTHYRIIERFTDFTYLKVILETGRTHQIRVHMASIDKPIVGDQLYGGRLRIPKNTSAELKEFLLHYKRQALHAKRLQLAHPVTHEPLSFEIPATDDFTTLLQLLRNNEHANKT
jgi:23S rRNA pseudouridine1911/1915/1917 synthase